MNDFSVKLKKFFIVVAQLPENGGQERAIIQSELYSLIDFWQPIHHASHKATMMTVIRLIVITRIEIQPKV
jgi:methylglyoxal synthase